MLLWPLTQATHLTCSMGKNTEWVPRNEASLVLCSLMTELAHTGVHMDPGAEQPRDKRTCSYWVESEARGLAWPGAHAVALLWHNGCPPTGDCDDLPCHQPSDTHRMLYRQRDGGGEINTSVLYTLVPSPFLFSVLITWSFTCDKIADLRNWPTYMW